MLAGTLLRQGLIQQMAGRPEQAVTALENVMALSRETREVYEEAYALADWVRRPGLGTQRRAAATWTPRPLRSPGSGCRGTGAGSCCTWRPVPPGSRGRRRRPAAANESLAWPKPKTFGRCGHKAYWRSRLHSSELREQEAARSQVSRRNLASLCAWG